jgi:hypothetical protein
MHWNFFMHTFSERGVRGEGMYACCVRAYISSQLCMRMYTYIRVCTHACSPEILICGICQSRTFVHVRGICANEACACAHMLILALTDMITCMYVSVMHRRACMLHGLNIIIVLHGTWQPVHIHVMQNTYVNLNTRTD